MGICFCRFVQEVNLCEWKWKLSILGVAGSLPAGLGKRRPEVGLAVDDRTGLEDLDLVAPGQVGLGRTEVEHRNLPAVVVAGRSRLDHPAVRMERRLGERRIVAADRTGLVVDRRIGHLEGRLPCWTSRPWCHSLGRWHLG